MSRRRLGLRKRLALNIFSELYASTVREHRLDTLFWECTLRCNLSCRHCGSDCRGDPGVADMPLADFLKVLDEEVTPHVDPADVLVIFSGGEVLVRADLEEAGAEVTRRGYPWGMVTNGMALTPERFGRLLDAGLKSVSVSLDGFEREHNYIRGNPRSYDRALEAVRMIVREPSLSYDVVTCVTGAMVPQLEAFRDMLLSEGVRHWRLFSIFPMGRAKNDPTLRMTDAQFREMLAGGRGRRAGSRSAMPAKASWAVTRPRSATISTNAPRVFRWLRSVSTGPFRGARRSAPTTIRETSTGIGSGTCGRTASSRSATANGRAGANAPIARCSATARAAACTCGATTANCSTATTAGCDRSEMVQIAPPDQVFVVFARIGLPVGHYVQPVGNAGHVAVHVVGEQNPFRGLFLPDECLERCNVQGCNLRERLVEQDEPGRAAQDDETFQNPLFPARQLPDAGSAQGNELRKPPFQVFPLQPEIAERAFQPQPSGNERMLRKVANLLFGKPSVPFPVDAH